MALDWPEYPGTDGGEREANAVQHCAEKTAAEREGRVLLLLLEHTQAGRTLQRQARPRLYPKQRDKGGESLTDRFWTSNLLDKEQRTDGSRARREEA